MLGNREWKVAVTELNDETAQKERERERERGVSGENIEADGGMSLDLMVRNRLLLRLDRVTDIPLSISSSLLSIPMVWQRRPSSLLTELLVITRVKRC